MHDQVLNAALFTPAPGGRWGLPMLFWGPPGVGKTAAVDRTTRAAGLPLEVVLASIREPADFAGLPIVTEGGVRLAAPDWARRLATHGRGAAFLDEVSTATPATQAALLRVVLDRVVGDCALPPGVRILAAANPPEQAAGGWDLAPPLAMRFLHVQYSAPSVDDWSAWAVGQAAPLPVAAGPAGSVPVTASPADIEAAVAKKWPGARAWATGLVAGFLRRRGGLIAPDRPADHPCWQGWPSPRTWELGICALAGARVHGLSESERDVLVDGCIGQGAGGEFAAWIAEADLPDPVAILAGNATWKPDRTRPDVALAVLSAIAGAAIDAKKPDRRKDFATAWTYCGLACEACGSDVAVPGARALTRAWTDKEEIPEAQRVCVKHLYGLSVQLGGKL